MRWSVPRSTRSSTHSRTSGTMMIGHIRFRAEADIGVPAKPSVQPRFAGIVDAAGAGDADLAIGDVGLGQQHALLVGVEAEADIDAVEDQRRFVVVAGEQDGAAADSRPASR